MIDKTTINRIMDAADIVDVVSEFVTLRKSGANYKGKEYLSLFWLWKGR